MQFFVSYILPPLISLIFSVVLAVITIRINKHFKNKEECASEVAALRERQEQENERNRIREEIKPLVEEIAEIHAELGITNGRIDGCVETEAQHIAAIRVSYRYRLVTLCRTYLRQGFITAEQFEQLNEFFTVYRAIGGNGQAETYYNRVIALPIVGEDEIL